MIQRIQSLFLLVAATCGILMFFTPVATYSGVSGTFTLDMLGIHYSADNETRMMILPLSLNVIASLLPLTTLFMFKRRRRQMKLCRLTMLVFSGLVAVIFLSPEAVIKDLYNGSAFETHYQPGVGLPLLALVCVFLATVFIKKDEKLVRSADRLR